MLTITLYLLIGAIIGLDASRKSTMTPNAWFNCIVLWPVVLYIWITQ